MNQKLLSHLTLAKDRRQFEPAVIPVGRIKYFRILYASNQQGITKINLLMLLFALPLMFCLFYLKSVFEQQVIAGYNFSGNLGIGYPGTIDSVIACKVALCDAYFRLVLCILPCIFLLGIASAGMFYVMRNYDWRAPVDKPMRTFFKGIKMYFGQYSLTFLIVCALMAGIAALAVYFAKQYLLGTASFWLWLGLIASGIVGYFVLTVLIHMLPMICAYKFTFFQNVKNSVILALYFALVTLFIAVIFILPFWLMLSSTFLMMLVVMFCVFVGFAIYGLMWTVYAHYTFDMSINYLLAEQAGKGKSKKAKKASGTTPTMSTQTPAAKAAPTTRYSANYKKKSKQKAKDDTVDEAETPAVRGVLADDNVTITIVNDTDNE